MGLIEETNELMLDWEKINNISSENHAYINEAALKESIRLKKAVFWSTSRNRLWFKGAESGNTFTLNHIFVNCEQNSLVFQVTPDKGNICHTSYNGVANNCYYRELDMDTMKLINLNEKKGN